LASADEPRPFASSPCSLHEMEHDWDQVKAWRNERRKALVKHRSAVAPDARRHLSQVVVGRLTELIDPATYPTLGFYWPIRGEIDARELARQHIAAGGHAALPVIVTKNAPVEFWEWRPGVRMERGIMDIPVPRERNVLRPDVLVIPLIGFDRDKFRLGYGGGYYDRTLAAAVRRPLAIGVGSAELQLHTIYPQPHDIPMDLIVTEEFVLGAENIRSRAGSAGAVR
jgi:5-formyltetrahydrofolate cyclo-ligase